MAIRKNTNPREMDLQPEMQKILMRNGMQAHVVSDGSGYAVYPAESKPTFAPYRVKVTASVLNIR